MRYSINTDFGNIEENSAKIIGVQPNMNLRNSLIPTVTRDRCLQEMKELSMDTYHKFSLKAAETDVHIDFNHTPE
jgi:hypothetical protein